MISRGLLLLALLFPITASRVAGQQGDAILARSEARALIVQSGGTWAAGSVESIRPPDSTSVTLIERRSGGLTAGVDAFGGIEFPGTRHDVRPAPEADGGSLRHRAGFRDIARSGLIGAGIGAGAGGVMELVDSDGEIADVWPVLLAVPGFLIGVTYSLVR